MRVLLLQVDMNPLYREQEVAHCLSLARVAAVVAADGHRDVCYRSILAATKPALPDLRAVVFMADSVPSWVSPTRVATATASPCENDALI